MRSARQKSLLILQAADDCVRPGHLSLTSHDAVAVAFWASPEFLARLERAGTRIAWALGQMARDYSNIIKQLYALARHYLKVVPLYREINPLVGWEVAIANALVIPVVAFKAHRHVLSEYSAKPRVNFLTPGDFQRAFFSISTDGGARLTISPGNGFSGRRRSPVHRLISFWRLCGEAYRDGDPARLIWTPLEVLDGCYKLRTRFWPTSSIAPGGSWFYGSYVNYTHSLGRHAVHRRTSPRWVINNYSARRGLPEGADWHYLWQFVSSDSRWAEHRQTEEEARAAIHQVPAYVDGLPLRALLSANSIICDLLSRALPQFLTEIDLMDAFLERAQPEELWVANQWGSEGFLVQLAKRRGIRVIQVQHGVLEQYYACAPIYSDRFLVWGEFWKQLVNPEARDRVEVVNPGMEVVPVERKRTAGLARVTFFTAPPDLIPFWNPSVVLWEVITLLHRLVEAGHPIIVRVHPVDRIQTWRSAWIRYAGTLPPQVRFDKGGSLKPVLRETDVAIMFFSTVFLNCLASGIPVVSLGWYPFMWREALEREGVIHFADSIEEAFQLVRELGRQSPHVPDMSHLLAPSAHPTIA